MTSGCKPATNVPAPITCNLQLLWMKMRLNGFLKVLPDGLIEKSQRNHFLIMCPEHIRQNYNLSEGEKAMAGAE
jgi:hypothetical protein